MSQAFRNDSPLAASATRRTHAPSQTGARSTATQDLKAFSAAKWLAETPPASSDGPSGPSKSEAYARRQAAQRGAGIGSVAGFLLGGVLGLGFGALAGAVIGQAVGAAVGVGVRSLRRRWSAAAHKPETAGTATPSEVDAPDPVHIHETATRQPTVSSDGTTSTQQVRPATSPRVQPRSEKTSPVDRAESTRSVPAPAPVQTDDDADDDFFAQVTLAPHGGDPYAHRRPEPETPAPAEPEDARTRSRRRARERAASHAHALAEARAQARELALARHAGTLHPATEEREHEAPHDGGFLDPSDWEDFEERATPESATDSTELNTNRDMVLRAIASDVVRSLASQAVNLKSAPVPRADLRLNPPHDLRAAPGGGQLVHYRPLDWTPEAAQDDTRRSLHEVARSIESDLTATLATSADSTEPDDTQVRRTLARSVHQEVERLTEHQQEALQSIDDAEQHAMDRSPHHRGTRWTAVGALVGGTVGGAAGWWLGAEAGMGSLGTAGAAFGTMVAMLAQRGGPHR